MQLSIGKRICVEKIDGAVNVSFDGIRVGYIQEIMINFSAYAPDKTFVSVFKCKESISTPIVEFVAEMAKEGFDVKWTELQDLPLLMTAAPHECWLEGAEPVALLEKMRKSAP